MILVDTSIWIEVLRAQRPLAFENVVDFDDVVTCLPVLQEALHRDRDYTALARVSTLRHQLLR